MKKILLLAAVVLSAGAAMAQDETLIDITPKAYNWANQEVGSKLVIKHTDDQWNTPYTFSWQLGGSEYLVDEGCITANACASADYIINGSEVVDLGGEIGKVLCFNGANSKAQEVLGFKTNASITDFFQLNIFSNPDNTPRGNWIRAKIVVNVFANTISTTDGIIKNMYWMDGDNNNLGSWFEENAVNSAQFIEYDDEGDPILDDNEDYVYDKNRWLTFEVDGWNQAEFIGDDKEGTTSKDMPMKWKFYVPATNLADATIFVKELKFYAIDGATDKDTPTAYAGGPHLSYGPCPEVADGIKTVSTEKASQEIYNLAGQRVSKTQRGIYIVNGKKVVK
ncbi:MAG: hypothetical protein IJ197_03075 [Bacteroidaceae bacterium]|nr:hypothetical protein [Bacteroidaceae bacterium]